jgi:hypothetical protein
VSRGYDRPEDPLDRARRCRRAAEDEHLGVLRWVVGGLAVLLLVALVLTVLDDDDDDDDDDRDDGSRGRVGTVVVRVLDGGGRP